MTPTLSGRVPHALAWFYAEIAPFSQSVAAHLIQDGVIFILTSDFDGT
jgi:hypothetical protein